MSGVTTDRIRNVALVGHGGSGKTTLSEALLARAGVIGRVGRVEDGTTVSDTEPEEQAHRQSLALTVLPFTWRDHKINLIDTPGYADFEHEALAALRVAELAVFVVSAVEGVEVTHERLWAEAARLGVPRMVFVNKLDRDRASFSRTLDQLRELFGAGIAPLELPIGEEGELVGVADLLTDEAITYDGDGPTRGPIPEDMEAVEHEVHDKLVEGIVVGDDDLLARYLDGEVPRVEELEATLARGMDDATVFPVVCGSATRGIGVDRLADYLVEIGPSPLDLPPTEVEAGDTTAAVPPDPSADTVAWVFKTLADQYGHVSVFKVLSGTVHVDDHLVNPRTGADERLHSLFSLRGREHLDVSEVVAGDIAAVLKLADTSTGDTLAARGTPVRVPRAEPDEPAFTIAVRASTQADDDKLPGALARLCEEDPALVVERDDATHQTLLRGTGETHLVVSLERLARKYGVSVETEEVRVAHRETITRPARAEGRHKKQSGGHGQFGVATVVIEPLERGAGFEFVDEVVGGAIPRQFIPAVQKGVEEAMAEGGVLGFPVVDVRVRCTDGKAHPVDSSEMSFKMAGRLAFREALASAGAVVLEPVSLLEVVVPADQQGDVMGDLNSRRARVQGTDVADGGAQVVRALVPTSELTRYAIDLRSMTHGRGRFTARHDHYDVMPSHLAEALGAR